MTTATVRFSRLIALAALMMLLVGAGMPGLTAAALDPTPTPGVFTPVAFPEEGKFDEDTARSIDLMSLPILPDFAPYAGWLRAIYEEGQRQGLSPDLFTKIGDCMTSSESFLRPIAEGKYALGPYTSLQAVIDRYEGKPVRTGDSGLDSFSNPSLAAASGFNAAAVLDSTWNDPELCEVDESPLACELRLVRPAVALIMFGTNDLKSLTPEQFDYYLRLVVAQTINRGVIPILSTFPNQPGQVEKSIFFNQIVVRVAQDYTIPLINLWRAFDPLPNQGIDPQEPTHMTKPTSGEVASFIEADLQAGHNLHNLLTLQALEGLLKVIG